MVSINYSSREVCCKIVYYGPGLSGKTTNLQYVHEKVPGNSRGKMISLATEADRTLYFDFLPLNIGTINGFAAKFQLYTVPGQVYYNATRKLVLRGVDGLVFVADSQPDKMDENIESLANLEDNLREYGYDPLDLPIVIQYNKRDLAGVMSIEDLNARLNPHGWPNFGASATIGTGIFDTLKLIIKLVLEKAKGGAKPSTPAASSSETQPAAGAPEMERQPAPVTVAPAAETPVATTATAVAQAPAAAPAVEAPVIQEAPAEEAVQYRPYPGSAQQETKETRLSASSFAPVRKEESDSETINKDVIKQEERGADEGSVAKNTPAMAPSLRRKGRARKRGFFKRLFGIR